VFQAAVIRALRQILAIFEVQQDQLQGVEDHIHQLQERLQQITSEVSSANTRVRMQMDELHRRVAEQQTLQQHSWDEKIVPVHTKISALSQQLTRELDGLRSQFSNERRELLALVERQRARERDVRRLAFAIEGEAPQSVQVEHDSPAATVSGRRQQEFDYFVFEERFRGDEKLIHDRQREYLEYFRGRSDVVDVGCGRGEFLELLREEGITARGVELGLDQYLLCREKGLDVVREDLFKFLESSPDDSLGGLFSAQVIEHLTAQDQLRYVALAYRKTSPGSPVIFETINALSVFAVLNNYMMDPTHIRLVHPKLLEFIMQSVKFRDVQLKFLSPVTDRTIPPLRLGTESANLAEFNSAMAQLNDMIYGYQDFAAIGWH
jgi:O-antigen chain-terminating methyltransferase